MNILLIGNYARDQQESMRRFAEVLLQQLSVRKVKAELLCPKAIVAGDRDPHQGLGKWLGYIDKFILFPRALRKHLEQARARGENPVVHICDQSNAIYTRSLAASPHLITCNDLLAIRSALGEFPQNHTGWAGRQLQRRILAGLKRARRITCISETTREEEKG